LLWTGFVFKTIIAVRLDWIFSSIWRIIKFFHDEFDPISTDFHFWECESLTSAGYAFLWLIRAEEIVLESAENIFLCGLQIYLQLCEVKQPTHLTHVNTGHFFAFRLRVAFLLCIACDVQCPFLHDRPVFYWSIPRNETTVYKQTNDGQDKRDSTQIETANNFWNRNWKLSTVSCEHLKIKIPLVLVTRHLYALISFKLHLLGVIIQVRLLCEATSSDSKCVTKPPRSLK